MPDFNLPPASVAYAEWLDLLFSSDAGPRHRSTEWLVSWRYTKQTAVALTARSLARTAGNAPPLCRSWARDRTVPGTDAPVRPLPPSSVRDGSCSSPARTDSGEKASTGSRPPSGPGRWSRKSGRTAPKGPESRSKPQARPGGSLGYAPGVQTVPRAAQGPFWPTPAYGPSALGSKNA